MGFDDYATKHRDELKAEGFEPLAGPYTRSEEGMMMTVIDDAERANKEVAFSHYRGTLDVWQRSKRKAA